MEEQIVKIKEVLYGYEKAGLIDNDPEKVLSYLTDDIMGIGMGEQGFVSSKKDILDIMLYTTKKDTDSVYELEFEDTTIRFISDMFANLCTKVEAFRMVNQSLSGGVLGTYISEHYPICFANDALLKMLGYERKEFEENRKRENRFYTLYFNR